MQIWARSKFHFSSSTFDYNRLPIQLIAFFFAFFFFASISVSAKWLNEDYQRVSTISTVVMSKGVCYPDIML